MVSWEYKIRLLPKSADHARQVLGLLGSQGWELVSVIPDDSQWFVSYFKRSSNSRKLDSHSVRRSQERKGFKVKQTRAWKAGKDNIPDVS